MTSVSLATFLAGAGVGLAVAVPIGPMGVLCIQRTLSFGLVAGMATGTGAATVHLAFGLTAALGVGAPIDEWISTGGHSLTFLTAGVLIWFAARILKRSATIGRGRLQRESWLRSFASAFLFGLSSPFTALLFVAAMPATGVTGGQHAAPLLASGVFLGSLAWWSVLSTSVALARDRLSVQAIVVVNRLSGLALAGVGVVMLAKALARALH
jgi:threonine/homoserine/homoserine lactone efflux protein